MHSIQDIENLIHKGRYFEARVKTEAAIKDSADPRFQQLLALTLAKSGMPEQAKEVLEPLFKSDTTNSETAGILGGIYKLLFKKNQDNKFAVLARTTYQQNFLTTKNFYTGINAATMAIIAGQGNQGRQTAAEVINLIDANSNDFWSQATLGEAWLLTKEKQKSITHYLEARKLAGKEWGKVQSAYDQLILLNHFITVPSEILKAFAPPGIIAFTGHMIDHPSRMEPRFPASIEKNIKEGIESAVRTIRANIGYCSLSCGSDILFAEAMAEAGGEVNIFLPFDREDYLRASVTFADDHWKERFERMEKMFSINYVTTENYHHNDDLFSFQNRIILGSAILRARINFTTPTLLTVLSETDIKQKEGGTRDTLSLWPFSDRHVNVNPDSFVSHLSKTENKSESRLPLAKDPLAKHVLYVVIADLPGATNFEKENFNKSLPTVIEDLLLKPEVFHLLDRMTAAFSSPNGALDLVKMISGIKKLGSNLVPRISLHAGALATGVDSDQEERLRLNELHNLTPPRITSAYGWFAASSILNNETLTVNFAGTVNTGESQQPTEVYSLQWRK